MERNYVIVTLCISSRNHNHDENDNDNDNDGYEFADAFYGPQCTTSFHPSFHRPT